VDHLLFLVHGIGSVCDLKFRTVEEVGKLWKYNNRYNIKKQLIAIVICKTCVKIVILMFILIFYNS